MVDEAAPKTPIDAELDRIHASAVNLPLQWYEIVTGLVDRIKQIARDLTEARLEVNNWRLHHEQTRSERVQHVYDAALINAVGKYGMLSKMTESDRKWVIDTCMKEAKLFVELWQETEKL